MQAVVTFLQSNWALVLLVVKSVLDLLFVISPKADAPGGVLDYIYQLVKKYLP